MSFFQNCSYGFSEFQQAVCYLMEKIQKPRLILMVSLIVKWLISKHFIFVLLAVY